MSPYLAIVLVVLALVGVPVGYVFYESALSPETWTYVGHGQWAAPGPVAGAGLPIFLIVGGAYWLIRRARKNTKQSAN